MHPHALIAEGGSGGRLVRLIQDVNGHFYVECDGGHAEEAWHRGAKSDATLRAEGYRPVVEVYPELHERPPMPAGITLGELYVAAHTPRRGEPRVYPRD